MKPSDYAECDGKSRLSPFYVKESAEWTIADVANLGDFIVIDHTKDDSPDAVSTASLYVIQVANHYENHDFLLIHDSSAFQISDGCIAEERKRTINTHFVKDGFKHPDVDDKIVVYFPWGHQRTGTVTARDVNGQIGVYTVQYKDCCFTDFLKYPWRYPLEKVKEQTHTLPVQIRSGTRKRKSPEFYEARPFSASKKTKQSTLTAETVILDDDREDSNTDSNDDSDEDSDEVSALKRIRTIAQQIRAFL